MISARYHSGLLAPDGDGVGYMSFAGETAGWKWFTMIVDYDSPFDGIYCDDQKASADPFNVDIPGLYFIAHDSVNGILTNTPVAVEELPVSFTVAQNTPNPFNPVTTISYTIPAREHVTIDIFNIAGQHVATLVDGIVSAGNHTVTWNAESFSAGVYFYTVTANEFSRTLKMTLMK